MHYSSAPALADVPPRSTAELTSPPTLRIGHQVRIVRGPLNGLTGTLFSIQGDECLTELSTTPEGVYVRVDSHLLVPLAS